MDLLSTACSEISRSENTLDRLKWENRVSEYTISL